MESIAITETNFNLEPSHSYELNWLKKYWKKNKIAYEIGDDEISGIVDISSGSYVYNNAYLDDNFFGKIRLSNGSVFYMSIRRNYVWAQIGVEPKFNSWEDFMSRTSISERKEWCSRKATTANRRVNLKDCTWEDVKPNAYQTFFHLCKSDFESETECKIYWESRNDRIKFCFVKQYYEEREYESQHLDWEDVWSVLEKSKGICHHCGSLALEKKPTKGSWEYIGRRIGSLDHLKPLIQEGDNKIENLVWCCLICNALDGVNLFSVVGNARILHDRGFGGYYPNVELPSLILRLKSLFEIP